MRYLLPLLALSASAFAFAQPVVFGVKGGLPLTEVFDQGEFQGLANIRGSNDWVVGPMLEVRFPLRLGIEVNALFRPLDYRAEGITARATGDSWQIPLLLKWRVLPGPIQPYVSGGPVFQWVRNIRVQATAGNVNVDRTTDDLYAGGAALGGGVEFRLGRLKIQPEVRYTRFVGQDVDLPAAFQDLLRFNKNQAHLLVGIAF
ncbi:MAG: outer membrane beta-barrel protein [Bryobacteraceae bacterium]|nr:outer membrane beta-barrel protein [Bryobacteraceae bacterium]